MTKYLLYIITPCKKHTKMHVNALKRIFPTFELKLHKIYNKFISGIG